ncbi:YggU family protein [Candidatus Bathyarchaeota archaeon]|nr:YggU family protein [Candidatus Bathyarchaeota archaeon]
MLITVDVKAGSNRESVEETGENHYMVHVKAPPRKGKANTAIIKLLRKRFGGQVFLVSGHTSSRKVFEVVE